MGKSEDHIGSGGLPCLLLPSELVTEEMGQHTGEGAVVNRFRLKACVKCGGDLVLDEGDWLCLQCGTYYYTGLHRLPTLVPLPPPRRQKAASPGRIHHDALQDNFFDTGPTGLLGTVPVAMPGTINPRRTALTNAAAIGSW